MLSRRLVVGVSTVVFLLVLSQKQRDLRIYLVGTQKFCQGASGMAPTCPLGPDSNKAMDELAASTADCRPCVPCWHQEEYQLRVIVLTYDRPESLAKVLDSLNGLLLDGDRAILDIWVDRSVLGGIPQKSIDVARSFRWQQGPVRVHVQQSHGGLHGQWIDTWRPRANSSELALILEDDVDLSPCAYRWVKAVHQRYQNRTDIAGYSLYEGAIVHMDELPRDKLFFHKRFGSQGFVPLPSHWRTFQTWYHTQQANKTFAPYVPDDPLITAWYRHFEHRCSTSSMWSIWFIYYTNQYGLYTVYPNLASYAHSKDPRFDPEQYLAFHRQESGLHYESWQTRTSKSRLIRDTACLSTYTDMVPHEAVKYRYDGVPESGPNVGTGCRPNVFILLLLATVLSTFHTHLHSGLGT